MDDSTTEKVQFIGFDITGGDIEYDILASQGPNTTLRKVSSMLERTMAGRIAFLPAARLAGWHIKPANARAGVTHMAVLFMKLDR